MKLIKKTEVTLELAVTFVVFCLFILGIINIWVWGHAQIAGRSNSYEQSRREAGNQDPGRPAGYNPSSLTEEEVILSN